MITLPDGTSAEIYELTNDAGVVTANLKVVWPDKSSARAFVTFSQPIQVDAGPLSLKGVEPKG